MLINKLKTKRQTKVQNKKALELINLYNKWIDVKDTVYSELTPTELKQINNSISIIASRLGLL